MAIQGEKKRAFYIQTRTPLAAVAKICRIVFQFSLLA